MLAERQINLLAVSTSEIKVSALIAKSELELAIRVLPLRLRPRRRAGRMSGEGLIAEPRAVHPTEGHARLAVLMHRGSEFLGCDVAILGGAMSWVSEHNLVSAISNAGGFGVIACGAMSPELLDAEIAETKRRTDRAFGQPHHHAPAAIRAHRRLRQAQCRPYRARWRPSARRRDRADQEQWRQARLFRSGACSCQEVDALRRGCARDRGNGSWRPHRPGFDVSSCTGNSAHRRKDIPVFVAGGIGRGEAIAAYLEMGAVEVQLGTRFVCAHESIAHANSSGHSSEPRRATPCLVCRSTLGFRQFPFER